MASIYYLTGPDGSGKSSYLEEVADCLARKGINVSHVWLRSPKIFSKPLMAYCRLVGLTKYQTVDGIRYGGHFFQRSRIISRLYPWLQVIDFRVKLLTYSGKFKSDDIVLMDRFSLDTLADLMVDTERFNLHKIRVGRMLLDLIPDNTKIIVLSTSEKNIRIRKVDTRHDPLLEKKIKAYAVLSKDLGLEVVDNNGDFQVVKDDIFHKLAL